MTRAVSSAVAMVSVFLNIGDVTERWIVKMAQMRSGVDRVQATHSAAKMADAYTAHKFVTSETTAVITATSLAASELAVVHVAVISVAQMTNVCLKSGRVIDTTTAAMDLTRKDVYIMVNVIK